MKLGILAASTFLGVVSLVPAASAQGDGQAMQEMGRTQQVGMVDASTNRIGTPAPASALQGVRPAAGMLTPTGPVRGFFGTGSSRTDGGDLRSALHRE